MDSLDLSVYPAYPARVGTKGIVESLGNVVCGAHQVPTSPRTDYLAQSVYPDSPALLGKKGTVELLEWMAPAVYPV